MDAKSQYRALATIILAGFILSVSYHYVYGTLTGRGYPYDTFLFMPKDRFNDFFNQVDHVKDRNPYEVNKGRDSFYPPFMYMVAYAFNIIPSRELALIAFLSGFTLYFIGYNHRNLKANTGVSDIKTLLIISFLTYPYLITIDRANLEALTFITLSLFIWHYGAGRMKEAIIFLACSIAMKLHPIILITLFLADRRYKEATATVLLAAALTLCGVFFLRGPPETTIAYAINAIQYNSKIYGLFDLALRLNSSLLGFCKMLVYFVLPTNLTRSTIHTIGDLYANYYPLAGMLGAIICAHTIFVEKTFWKRVAILMLASILLPHYSGDYKLLSLFIPMTLLLSEKRPQKKDAAYLSIFALILVPKQYVVLQMDVTLSTLINPALMMLLLILLMADGLRPDASDERKRQKPKKRSL